MTVFQTLLRLQLDEQGREQLACLLADLSEQVTQIEAESADRLSGAPDAPVYESSVSIVPFCEPVRSPRGCTPS